MVWPDSTGNWSSGPLSHKQLVDYNQKGYLLLEGLFSDEEVKEMLQITTDIRDKYNQEILHQDRDVTITQTSRMVTEEGGAKIK